MLPPGKRVVVTELANDPREAIDSDRLIVVEDQPAPAPGPGEVVVRVRCIDRHLTLDVEDRGPGIDPEDARRVFERFFRGRSAHSSGARGSGIGLAIVRHIAQAHGGDATVLPTPGGGTTFRVRIPVETVPDAEDA